MDADHLYNQQMWGDLWLELNKTSHDNYNTVGFKKYLKYATTQGGLFGFFTERTPKELIEGYNDPLVMGLAELPIFMGGDTLSSPFLSIIFSPVNTKDNRVAFFQGDGTEKTNYLLTRSYGKWLDRT